MVKLQINGRMVEAAEGSTLLEAALSVDIDIPTLCHLPGEMSRHSPSCMVCVVEVEGRAALAPACACLAEEGMVVRTDTQRVLESRRNSLELLLSDHAGDCVAPCTRTCPAGFDAAAMVAAVRQGNLFEARRLVRDTLPFAGVLGMICAGYCERACHRRLVDAPVAIGDIHGALATDFGEALGREQRSISHGDNGRAAEQAAGDDSADVAIVGGGPAGVVAAWELARLGFSSRIFEAVHQLGGTLRQVEAMGRLPHGLLDYELSQLNAPGVMVQFDQVITGEGGAVSLAQLRRRHKAVILAAGALAAESPLRAELAAEGLEFTPRGVQVDRRTMATNQPAVFAVGAITGAGRNLALYVGQARRAAAAIADLLTAGTPVADGESADGVRDRAARWAAEEPSPSHLISPGEDDLSSMLSAADGGARHSAERAAWDGSSDPSAPAAPRTVLNETDMVGESRRCMECSCEKLLDCRLRHLAIEFDVRQSQYKGHRRTVARDFSHPMVVYDSGKCIQCGICIRIASRQNEGLGLASIGRGFSVRTGVPFGENVAAALRVAARQCAAACPTAAITMKRQFR